MRMLMSPPGPFQYILIALLFVLMSCQSSREQSNTEDSVLVLTDSVTVSTADTVIIEEENINDEDHGGPGLSDTQIIFDEVEIASQDFLTHLMKREFTEIIDPQTAFVILEPGPGVAPIARVGKSSKDILDVNEMVILLSDSSFIGKDFPFQTWHFDKCQSEYLPDAIYLDNVFIEEVNPDFFREDDKADAKQVQEQWKGLEYRYAKVFNVKLTTKTGELVLFSFTAFLRNEKLFLMTIDLTDCGA